MVGVSEVGRRHVCLRVDAYAPASDTGLYALPGRPGSCLFFFFFFADGDSVKLRMVTIGLYLERREYLGLQSM